MIHTRVKSEIVFENVEWAHELIVGESLELHIPYTLRSREINLRGATFVERLFKVRGVQSIFISHNSIKVECEREGSASEAVANVARQIVLVIEEFARYAADHPAPWPATN